MGTWYDQRVAPKGATLSPREIAPGVWATGPIRHTAQAETNVRAADMQAVRVGAEGDAVARGTAKPADVNAYSTVKQIPGLTEPERQYLLAVARGEGYYGLGWSAGAGAGSHNWGAVQGSGSAGSFQHLDHHADGTPYTTAFKAYASDREGATDMARILLKPNVKAVLNRTGSLHDAVYTQHGNGYFELAPEKYLAAVLRNYGAIRGMFPKAALSEKGKTLATAALVTAFAAGVVGGTAFLIARRRVA